MTTPNGWAYQKLSYFQNSDKTSLVKYECPHKGHFSKISTFLFDLDLDRWPWPWYWGHGLITRNRREICKLSVTIQKLWPVLILSQTSPGFYVSAVQVFWKHYGKRITSNFSFFHSVFYLFGKLSAIFIKFELSSSNSLNLEESKLCHLAKV